MRTTKRQRAARFFEVMAGLGFNADETETLLRAERALQRWSELECGTGDDRRSVSVYRDEQTGKPFRRVQFYSYAGKWVDRREPCRDMEAAALRRVAAIAEAHPGMSFYHQGDPRGCALYLIRPGDVIEGADVGSYYSRGIAICTE
jgi:hypothetical protein